MTYRDAVAAISALEPRGWRLGLDRMQEFCRRAGLQDALGKTSHPRFVHIAGTNGKGSTTAFVQSILVAAGYRVGAFYSPYVIDYRERIQIGLDLIRKRDLADCTAALLPIAESLSETEFGGVTKFEFEAALGFAYWKKQQCDWVALEVGLGGRLDATNVVTPAVSIIVSIGLDHVGILGDTVEKIAAEKAGIVKSRVPVIVGQMADSSAAVIEARAKELVAPVWRFGRDIFLEDFGETFSVTTPRRRIARISSGMAGTMQPHNAALAIAALDAAGLAVGAQPILDGVEKAFAPGRFQQAQYEGAALILDGAHNRQAAAVLRQTLDRLYPGTRLHLVTNMLSGHDVGDFYRELACRIATADVVPVEAPRALPTAEIAKLLRALVPEVREHSDVKSGLDSAAASAKVGDLVLITGSNYLVGEIARIPGVTARKRLRE